MMCTQLNYSAYQSGVYALSAFGSRTQRALQAQSVLLLNRALSAWLGLSALQTQSVLLLNRALSAWLGLSARNGFCIFELNALLSACLLCSLSASVGLGLLQTFFFFFISFAFLPNVTSIWDEKIRPTQFLLVVTNIKCCILCSNNYFLLKPINTRRVEVMNFKRNILSILQAL